MTTRVEGERLRAREQIDRLRASLHGLLIAVGDTSVPPGWDAAQAVADTAVRLAATVARLDAYMRAEDDAR